MPAPEIATRPDQACRDPLGASAASFLREFLAERDFACPLCGYNLRNLTGTRCPECGHELQLRVGLVEPRQGAYIVTLVAWCVSFGGIVLLDLVGLNNVDAGWWQREGMPLLIQTAISTPLFALMLVLRRRLRCLPQAVQWSIAIISWLLVVAMSAWVVATVN